MNAPIQGSAILKIVMIYYIDKLIDYYKLDELIEVTESEKGTMKKEKFQIIEKAAKETSIVLRYRR